MAIIEESYGDFSKRVHGKAAGKRVPVNLDYDVTYRCNLNCRHCYCNLPANDAAAKAAELTLPEITRILTEARDLGALWILLTGGEPLLRPDFKEIYLTTLRLGLIPTVFTNGTLITEEWADFFAEHRPFKMEITLYGSNAEVYERVTRTPGSFDKCMRGIRLLKERGLPLGLKTMVMKSNVEDLENTRQLAKRLGPSFRLDQVLHARYPDLPAGDVSPVDERISVEEVLRVDLCDEERSDAWFTDCQRLLDLREKTLRSTGRCGAGYSRMSISPDGTIRPCALLRQVVGWNARRVSLDRIWDESIGCWLESPASMPERCDDCQLLFVCNCCSAWAFVETGSERGHVDYLCLLALERASIFCKKKEETA